MSSGNYSSGSNRGGRSHDRYYDQYYADDGYYGSSSSSYRGNYRPRGRGSYRGRGNDYYNSRSYSNGGYGSYYNNRGGNYNGYRTRDDKQGDEYNGTRTEPERSSNEQQRDHSPDYGNGSYDSPYTSYNGSYRGNYRGRGSNVPRGRGGYSHSNYGRSYHDEKRERGIDASNSSRSSISLTHTHKQSISPAKVFQNPWITILNINDSATQQKLESKYVEMHKLDKNLIELQRDRLKLEIAVENLEAQAEREKIHVQITNEKLDEFTYL